MPIVYCCLFVCLLLFGVVLVVFCLFVCLFVCLLLLLFIYFCLITVKLSVTHLRNFKIELKVGPKFVLCNRQRRAVVGSTYIPCIKPTGSRVLRITKDDTHLTICEVQVIGRKIGKQYFPAPYSTIAGPLRI